MKNRYKILGLIGIIAIIAFISIASSAENIGSASCNYFSVQFFGMSGYSCTEQSGMIRTFLNPDAYNNMVNFYVPPMEQIPPPYTFIDGGQTQAYSGRLN